MLVTELFNTLRQSGLDVTINSSTGGYRRGQHPVGDALDINRISNASVDNPSNSKNVAAFQEALADQPNIFSNYGPDRQTETHVRGKKRNDYTLPKMAKSHKNHIHASAQNARESAARKNAAQ